MSSKVKQITDESFYRKRLASVDPIWEEYYLGVAKKLIEQGYESPRLLDNIIEALPRELDPEFYSIMYKINPRLNENADLAEKKSARAIVRHLATIGFFEGKSYGLYKGSGKPGGAMKDFLNKKAEKMKKEKDKQKPEYKNNPAFGDPSHHSNKKMSEAKRWWQDDIQEKKAAKDYDGDGKVESGKAEYFGSRDKAIKKAMGKKVKHDCSSKVKHEEYGIGDCIKEMHTLDEHGNISHYDVLFTNKVVKNVPVEDLEVLVSEMHEHYINDEKNKEVVEGSMKQARKNVGASTCWDGYKAKGTKKKGGKVVPNCVKEEDIEEGKDGLWDNVHQKRERMKAGSGEKKAKPGDKDYPKTLNVENTVLDTVKYVVREGLADSYVLDIPIEIVDFLEQRKLPLEVAEKLSEEQIDYIFSLYIEEEKKQPKNCGCGQNPCITYGKQSDSKDSMAKV